MGNHNKYTVALAEMHSTRRGESGALRRMTALAANYFVKLGGRDMVLVGWQTGSNTTPYLSLWPWRLPAGFVPADKLRALPVQASTDLTYPPAQTAMSVWDAFRSKLYCAPFSLAAATTSRVIGAIQVMYGVFYYQQPVIVSHLDVPVVTLGTPFLHPTTPCTTLGTTAGSSYVNGLPGLNVLGDPMLSSWLRITSGPDVGVYKIDNVDYKTSSANWRAQLRNLDGTLFSATATASNVFGALGARQAFFNEVGIIPNGTGQTTVAGLFNPGESRNSYIFRLRFDKTGGTSPANPAQKGSYFLSVRPWTHDSNGSSGIGSVNVVSGAGSATNPGFLGELAAITKGGCPGTVLDRVNQRYWMCSNDGTNGTIQWWAYKTPEQFHCVASTGVNPTDPMAGLVLGTATMGLPRSMDIGSDGTVYVTTAKAAGGSFVAISPALVASQIAAVNIATANAAAMIVDQSRARVGAAGDVTTSSNIVTSASGAFTAADIGRVIQITTGADAGLYKIATITDATHVVVTQLNGTALTFLGAAGATFTIGDRAYLFFNDTTSSPVGTITYMESLAWGVKHTRAMLGTPVNGATINPGLAIGYDVPACIDASNGVLYWASSDVAQQVNRYDPATNTWSRRLMTDFAGLNGGAGTIVAPTQAFCLGVNPHASFRELWIGTDAGWVKLSPDAFAGTFSRYYGDAAANYTVGGFAKSDGGQWANNAYQPNRQFHRIRFAIDGRAYGVPYGPTTGAFTTAMSLTIYVRESDTWTPTILIPQPGNPPSTGGFNFNTSAANCGDFLITPYGDLMTCYPDNLGGGISSGYFVSGGVSWAALEITYQWIGNQWVPKEEVRGAVPTPADFPGLQTKDLHEDYQALLYGVKVKFAQQGGATPSNNEFLGRMGTTGAARTDGATTNAAATFDGSGFVAGDVGRILRIHGGANAGVYRIATYVTANRVTLSKMNPGLAFSASGTAAGLTYSIWEASNGPELVTFYAANGFGKDNTQDINGISASVHWLKTRIAAFEDPVKFCIPPLGMPGSTGVLMFGDSFVSNVVASGYQAHTPQALALSTASSPGDFLTLGLNDVFFGGPLAYPAGNQFGSLLPGTGPGMSGYAVTVDLGRDLEIGSFVAKFTSQVSYRFYERTPGLIANIHTAPTAAVPVSASVARFTGTGLTVPVTSTTATLATGDFLGPLLTSGVNGTTVLAGNRFTAASIGVFTAVMVGAALKITAGGDIGAYRIIAVAADGSWADVQNLDQSPKGWATSSSTISFEIRDSAREDDLLAIPNAAATTRVTIERLLSPTQAQTRSYFTVVQTAVAFAVVKPTWALVKRMEHLIDAPAPDVINNGTFITSDGRDANDITDFRVQADFSDLPSAKRTGRYWKLSFSPRTNGSPQYGYAYPTALTFYDVNGKQMGVTQYNRVAAADADPTFVACQVSRADFILGSDTAAGHVAGTNGLASVGGVNEDIVTLAGGNKFLGYQLRQGTTGSAPGSAALLTIGGGDPPFYTSDVGRIVRIISGVNAGYYMVSVVQTTTSVILTSPAGNVVVLAADPTMSWALHEGILTNGADVLAFTTGGAAETNKENAIVEIADNLTYVRLADKFSGAVVNQNWEIRRPGAATASTVVDATLSARITNTAVYQAGDIQSDSRGALVYYPSDIGVFASRSDGATTLGGAAFTGSGFTPDDVGRIITIMGGADQGSYIISAFTSATAITVKNAYTGGVVSFAATAGTLTYQVRGERRVRITRYAIGQRT